jgi:hypothetical protein
MELGGRFHSQRLPWEIAPGSLWIGNLMGPRSSLDVWKRQIYALFGNRTKGFQPTARRCTDCDISWGTERKLTVKPVIELSYETKTIKKKVDVLCTIFKETAINKLQHNSSFV